MKRILVGITLALVILCFVKGSSRGNVEDRSIIESLNEVVDTQLDQRLFSLRLGEELSQGLTD
ncbi:MAG: hypothetical protein JRJ87_17550 [Deltaproteobacteria bacterium]|nr:hypothetical protein [Deltaproteobacteria bacterium]